MYYNRKYLVKAKLCKKLFGKSKFYIGERVDFQYNPTSFWDSKEVNSSLAAIYDASYVRYKTIEMLAREVSRNSIEGSVAEVGVYKGQTSYALNLLFPEKSLYLFDTFEGFDSRQASKDIEEGYSAEFYDLSDTDAAWVLDMMPHKDKCIIKKGLFPQTAEGVEDTFCMVSLDTDLYQPILDGLKFFVPRLAKGGYIIIHDYNNQMLKGVKQAVLDYEKDYGLLQKVPVADLCGSLVITK